MTLKKIPITVAAGDGIGPEIMQATLALLNASGAPLSIEEVEIGEKVYLRGVPTGIEASTWNKIRNSKAFLKAPITTPQGGGYKSLNVTVRTTLGLYANVRPCVSYFPFIATKHPRMDVVIIRENEEDMYMGIEYRQTPETFEALKIMTRSGCERIIRYAFEYAKAFNRKKVTCFTKDNILKLTDGLFHKVFEEIGAEYPELVKEHWIVDIGAAKLADTPEDFDVIVLPNLYGDILSDVAAQITGSVGLAGSANIGTSVAMFEAIHGSAPRRAGQNVANPSGLILASVLMLLHVGLSQEATAIHNAWLKTIEEGVHTYDIFKEATSKKLVGTKEFAEEVISRLGQKPQKLPSVHYGKTEHIDQKVKSGIKKIAPPKQEWVGIDIFIYWNDPLDTLVQKLSELNIKGIKLKGISNRGVQVWPKTHPETICSDNWRCRFMSENRENSLEIGKLITLLIEKNFTITQTNSLFAFDGQKGFSIFQDE